MLLTSSKYTVYFSLKKMAMFGNIHYYESNLFRLKQIIRLRVMTSNCFSDTHQDTIILALSGLQKNVISHWESPFAVE